MSNKRPRFDTTRDKQRSPRRPAARRTSTRAAVVRAALLEA